MIKILYAMYREQLPEDFEDNLSFTDGEYEVMLFEVPVYIEVDGKMGEYPSRTAILYRPNQKIHYTSVKGPLIYTWIRFDCDETLFSEGYVPFGLPIFCENYDYFLKYFHLAACENYWRSQSADFILSELMHIIFHWLHDYAFPTKSSRYFLELQKLRGDIYSHPEWDWSLEMMAKKVNMSVRLLQKVYKDYTHISCLAEVIESRMSYAKMLLTRTDNDLTEISMQCGYHNLEHFCRQFKKHEGISPGKYRRQHETT